MTTTNTVLIDGDQFLFQATAALEKEIRWDDNHHVLYADEEHSWINFVGMLNRIFDRFDTRKHYLCFSDTYGDKPNFRLGIDPTYKLHRKASRKPMCYAALRERCDAEYRTKAVPGLEADDVMGILATAPRFNSIIVSQDKDMKTVPATVWDGKCLDVITEAVADYNHLYQTLIGDQADGYKGCPGVGPVKAEKLLINCDNSADMWAVVKDTYEKKGLTEADALVQARLARILRWSDWDSEKKEPILWLPI
jgi:5'-3' exonuclease